MGDLAMLRHPLICLFHMDFHPLGRCHASLRILVIGKLMLWLHNAVCIFFVSRETSCISRVSFMGSRLLENTDVQTELHGNIHVKGKGKMDIYQVGKGSSQNANTV